MLSDLRQLCMHHPCGFTSCKVGLWFLPAWRSYHYTAPIVTHYDMYSRSALEHSPQLPCPPRPCSPQSPSAFFAFSPLARRFHSPRAPADSTLRSRQSHCSSSILPFQTPPHSFFFRIPPNSCPLSLSCALFAKNTGGWPPLVAGRRPPATLP